MGNSAKAVILAEDECHQNLAYKWLRERGLTAGEIRKLPLPAGGSGEQWVRERYPDQLAAIRERCSKMKCWLYVLTDADTGTVEDRLRGLPLGSGDPVTLLVPRRNVETWVEALTVGGGVDEVTDYTGRHPDPASGTEAGKRLAQARAPEEAWPPSLKLGHAELGRSLQESGLFER